MGEKPSIHDACTASKDGAAFGCLRGEVLAHAQIFPPNINANPLPQPVVFVAAYKGDGGRTLSGKLRLDTIDRSMRAWLDGLDWAPRNPKHPLTQLGEQA